MGDPERLAIAALGTVIDPEMGLDIVSMGLVYDVRVDDGVLRATMTLTSAGCPMGEVIIGMAQQALARSAGTLLYDLQVVFSPAWSPAMIDPTARESLL